MNDLNQECDILQQYVENGRLQLWFKDIVEVAHTVATSLSPTTHNIGPPSQAGGQSIQGNQESKEPIVVKAKLNWL
jgi:hypothetical protein